METSKNNLEVNNYQRSTAVDAKQHQGAIPRVYKVNEKENITNNVKKTKKITIKADIKKYNKDYSNIGSTSSILDLMNFDEQKSAEFSNYKPTPRNITEFNERSMPLNQHSLEQPSTSKKITSSNLEVASTSRMANVILEDDVNQNYTNAPIINVPPKQKLIIHDPMKILAGHSSMAPLDGIPLQPSLSSNSLNIMNVKALKKSAEFNKKSSTVTKSTTNKSPSKNVSAIQFATSRKRPNVAVASETNLTLEDDINQNYRSTETVVDVIPKQRMRHDSISQRSSTVGVDLSKPSTICAIPKRPSAHKFADSISPSFKTDVLPLVNAKENREKSPECKNQNNKNPMTVDTSPEDSVRINDTMTAVIYEKRGPSNRIVSFATTPAKDRTVETQLGQSFPEQSSNEDNVKNVNLVTAPSVMNSENSNGCKRKIARKDSFEQLPKILVKGNSVPQLQQACFVDQPTPGLLNEEENFVLVGTVNDNSDHPSGEATKEQQSLLLPNALKDNTEQSTSGFVKTRPTYRIIDLLKAWPSAPPEGGVVNEQQNLLLQDALKDHTEQPSDGVLNAKAKQVFIQPLNYGPAPPEGGVVNDQQMVLLLDALKDDTEQPTGGFVNEKQKILFMEELKKCPAPPQGGVVNEQQRLLLRDALKDDTEEPTGGFVNEKQKQLYMEFFKYSSDYPVGGVVNEQQRALLKDALIDDTDLPTGGLLNELQRLLLIDALEEDPGQPDGGMLHN